MPSNINETAEISYRGHKWHVFLAGDKIRLNSLREYDIDESQPHMPEIEKRVNQITGHARNLACFAFDMNVKWGMNWGYAQTHVSEDDFPFPSTHQSGQSTQYNATALAKDIQVFRDLSKNRAAYLPNMLNYWRRGYELDKLGFDSEAFLNFFKILEVFKELGSSTANAAAIKQRFIPNNRPQSTLCREFHAKTPNNIRTLRNNISFAAAVAAAAGYDKNVPRGNMRFLIRCVYIRNSWNVGHKLFRKNPYDTYDAVGQHSDEFGHTMIENIWLSEFTKYLILRYAKPGRYRLAPHGNMYFVEPI